MKKSDPAQRFQSRDNQIEAKHIPRVARWSGLFLPFMRPAAKKFEVTGNETFDIIVLIIGNVRRGRPGRKTRASA
jgi:hypothetical protein